MSSKQKYKKHPDEKSKDYLNSFISFIIFLVLQIPLSAKSQEADTLPFHIEMYRITEAYSETRVDDSVKVDTIKTFTAEETDLFLFYVKNTDTLFFRLEQKDSVILSGLTVVIPNPGFTFVEREDAKFFTGDFWYFGNSGKGAIMKEYVTNSYQRRKKMYFFFQISLPFENKEFQLYGYDTNPFTQDDPVINAIKRGAEEGKKQKNGL